MKYKVKISNFVFGVPATFIADNYNAERFLLLGVDESCGAGLGGGLRLHIKGFCGSAYVNNHYAYRRVFIRLK